jgi:zinc protease
VIRAQDGSLARTLAADLFLKRTLYWDEQIEKRIAVLSPEVIVAALRRHLDPARFTIVKAGDFEKNPPAPAAGPAK